MVTYMLKEVWSKVKEQVVTTQTRTAIILQGFSRDCLDLENFTSVR